MHDIDPTDGAGAVDRIADLARRVATNQQITPPADGVVIRVTNDGENITPLDLELIRDAPRRARGQATLSDPADFSRYVTRLADEHTTVWANEEGCRFTAVFNDHDPAGPGWRDHTAEYQLKRDPDWQAWLQRNGELSNQLSFAEFLEDQALAIVSPDAATMREVAMSFRARGKSAFSRGVRLDNGDVALEWHEETSATAGKSGQPVEVPEFFTVRLSPYVGVAPVELIARLRWKIREGQLGIGYRLHRPADAERAAFDAIRASVSDNVPAPVYMGQAPTLNRSLLSRAFGA